MFPHARRTLPAWGTPGRIIDTVSDYNPDEHDRLNLAEDLSESLEQHIAEFFAVRGRMISGFVCYATFTEPSGQQAWAIAVPDEQLVVHTRSMLREATEWQDALAKIRTWDHLRDDDMPPDYGPML